MKWLFAVLSVFIGGAIGWYISKKKKRKEIIHDKLYSMCNIIKNNLQFSQEPVGKVIEGAGRDCADIKRLIDIYCARRDDESAQKKELNDAARACSLPASEAETVAEFFAMLGKSDASSQIGSVDHFQTLFDGYRAEAHAEWKKTGSLYWKLGLLIGCGVAILIL